MATVGVTAGRVMAGTPVTADDGTTVYQLQMTAGGTGASSDQIQGAQARGAAVAANPILAGGRAGSAAPTAVTAGQLVDNWLGLNGETVVSVAFGAQIAGSNAALADATTNTISRGYSQAFGMQFNGASWDRQRKPNSFSRAASTVAAGNPAVAKASAGDLTMFWGQNGAAITYLQFYNKASAPTIGTDTPILTYPVAALAFFSETIPNGGAYFSTGIAYALTTDAAGTTGAAAAAVTALGVIVA